MKTYKKLSVFLIVLVFVSLVPSSVFAESYTLGDIENLYPGTTDALEALSVASGMSVDRLSVTIMKRNLDERILLWATDYDFDDPYEAFLYTPSFTNEYALRSNDWITNVYWDSVLEEWEDVDLKPNYGSGLTFAGTDEWHIIGSTRNFIDSMSKEITFDKNMVFESVVTSKIYLNESLTITNTSNENININGSAFVGVGVGDKVIVKMDSTVNGVNYHSILRLLPTHNFVMVPNETMKLTLIQVVTPGDYVQYNVPVLIAESGGVSQPPVKVYKNSQFGAENVGIGTSYLDFDKNVTLDYILEYVDGTEQYFFNKVVNSLALGQGVRASIKVVSIQSPYEYALIQRTEDIVITTTPFIRVEGEFGDDVIVIDNEDTFLPSPTEEHDGSLIGQWYVKNIQNFVGQHGYKWEIDFIKESMWDDKDDIELEFYINGYRFIPPVFNEEQGIFVSMGFNPVDDNLIDWGDLDYRAHLVIFKEQSSYLDTGKHILYAIARWKGEVRKSEYIYVGYTQEELDLMTDPEGKLDTDLEVVDETLDGDGVDSGTPGDDGLFTKNPDGSTTFGLPYVEFDDGIGSVINGVKSNWDYAMAKLEPSMSSMLGGHWLWMIFLFVVIYGIIKHV